MMTMDNQGECLENDAPIAAWHRGIFYAGLAELGDKAPCCGAEIRSIVRDCRRTTTVCAHGHHRSQGRLAREHAGPVAGPRTTPVCRLLAQQILPELMHAACVHDLAGYSRYHDIRGARELLGYDVVAGWPFAPPPA